MLLHRWFERWGMSYLKNENGPFKRSKKIKSLMHLQKRKKVKLITFNVSFGLRNEWTKKKQNIYKLARKKFPVKMWICIDGGNIFKFIIKIEDSRSYSAQKYLTNTIWL